MGDRGTIVGGHGSGRKSEKKGGASRLTEGVVVGVAFEGRGKGSCSMLWTTAPNEAQKVYLC